MLIKQTDLIRIRSGEITLAFRAWKSPRVKKGSLIKSSLGMIKILDIELVERAAITSDASRQAGFDSLDALWAALRSDRDPVYKIQLKFHGEDPLISLRNQTSFSPAQLEALQAKLKKMDNTSRSGAWTLQVLQAIDQHPRVRAADLAAMLTMEKYKLKINIRKLKNLGLTISEPTGYTISPRGSYYLARLKH